MNEELDKKGPIQVEKKLPDPNRPEDVEPLRDEIEKAVINGQRLQKLLNGKLDRDIYSRHDLGLFAEGEIAQSRDNGIAGDNIQRLIDKIHNSTTYESRKDSEAKLFVVKMLSKGFLGYLKLRKLLGITKESFSISQWNRLALERALPLINPGGLVWIKEGSYNIATMLSQAGSVAIKGAGNPSTHVVATTSGMTMLSQSGSLGNLLLDLELDADLKAAKCIDWINSWSGHVRTKIIDLPTNSVGLRLYIDNYNWGCYMNDIWITDIRNTPTKPSGSIGVLLDTEEPYPNFCEPNNNVMSGYWHGLDVGIKFAWGMNNKCYNLAIESSNTAYLVERQNQLMVSGHEENNTNYGIRLTRTAAVGSPPTSGYPEKWGTMIWIGGYYEKLSFEHEKNTFIAKNYDGDVLEGKYVDPTHWGNTPFIAWAISGNYGPIKMRARGDGEFLEFLDSNGKLVLRLAIPVNNAGSVRIHRSSDEYELGSLMAGSNSNRPCLKFWDVTANAYKYAYIDNGAWVISSSMPT